MNTTRPVAKQPADPARSARGARLLRHWTRGLGRRSMLVAALAAAIGAVCVAVSLYTIGSSLGLRDVGVAQEDEARIFAFEKANHNLVKMITGTATGYLPSIGPTPIQEAWAAFRTALAAVCAELPLAGPDIDVLRQVCDFRNPFHQRVSAAIDQFDPPARPFDVAVLREMQAVRDDIISLRDWTHTVAGNLEDQMAHDYERARLALMLGGIGFTVSGLVLLVLVLRASLRHYDLAQSAAAAADEAGQVRDLLHEVVEGLPAGVVVYDRDERLVLWNALAAEISPLLRDPGRIGMTYEEIVREMAKRQDGSTAAGAGEEEISGWIDRFRRHVPHTHRLPDGRWFEWSSQAMPSGRIIGMRVDVTRSKEQEELLARARDRYQVLIDSLQDMVYTIDADGRFLYASPAARTLFGMEPAALFGRRLLDFVPPEDISLMRDGRDFSPSDVPDDQEVRQRSIRIVGADGVVRHVEVRYRKPINAASSEGAAQVGVIRDVSTMVNMMERLADERTRLRSIVESSGAIVVLTDRNLNVEMANREFASIRDVGDLGLALDVLERWRSTRLEPDEARALRYSSAFVDDDGRKRILSVTAKPMVGPDGWLHQIVFLGVDDTERREAEQALFNADRMATLGEMAATVAHELRQPLQVIDFACGSALDEIQTDGRTPPDISFLAAKLTRINGQIERADRIIEDLRLYARGVAVDSTRPFDPAAAIRAAVDMTSATARQARMTVHLSLDAELSAVRGDAGKLEQVLINLINNARDAGARTAQLSARVEESEGRRMVRITLADDGPGIPAEILPRLFNSFVTTKSSGRGTGLGLRICRRLVEEMGGSISAANRSAGGAQFDLLLPAVPPTDTRAT